MPDLCASLLESIGSAFDDDARRLKHFLSSIFDHIDFDERRCNVQRQRERCRWSRYFLPIIEQYHSVFFPCTSPVCWSENVVGSFDDATKLNPFFYAHSFSFQCFMEALFNDRTPPVQILLISVDIDLLKGRSFSFFSPCAGGLTCGRLAERKSKRKYKAHTARQRILIG